MPIDLYYPPQGSICQSVFMLADTLGIKLNLKKTEGSKGETRTPEFIKMNPQHTVPTIHDNGFYLWESPCQSIRMLADTLGIDLVLKETHLYKGDHKTPEFLKMNPQHCIPTLNDNGFYLWESRAILGYLVDQYAKDDSLYPKDPKKRAVVNQRLYFDIGTLYPKYSDFYMPIIYGGKSPNPEHVAAFGQPIELLEKFLEGHEWVAGDHITIADYAIVCTISHMEANGYDMSKHPNVHRWLTKTKKSIASFNDIVPPGIAILLGVFKVSVKS